jgi:hypothetical protein
MGAGDAGEAVAVPAPPDRSAWLRSVREPALPGIGTVALTAEVELW